jgi:hypothetical protein
MYGPNIPNGCLTACIIFAAIGCIATVVLAIKAIIWLFNHVHFS